MKKKTKSSSSNNFTLAFWLTILCCLLGCAVNTALFYNSFFEAFTKLNEEPIATITFKYKTAQRKFMDRLVWDRLRQESPVYNGDTIHTAALSEAIIWFKDGNVMELSQNTMAQVFISESDTLTADLQSGDIYLDSSQADSGITLSSSGVEVTLEKGSSLNASQGSDAGLSLQVVKGIASVGGEKSISEGETVSVDGHEAKEASISVMFPRKNSKILYHTDGEEKVLFNWSVSNQQDGDSLILEIAQDKDFLEVIKHVSVNDISSLNVSLKAGTYYWRIFVKDGPAATGRFQILQSLPPTLIAPVQDYEYSYRSKNPAVRLIWSESAYATAYNLQIADNPDFKNPVVEQRSASTSSIISSLSRGKWYWRVTPYYTINKIGFRSPSQTGSFTVEKKNSLGRPVVFVPGKNAYVNSGVEGESSEIAFSWKLEHEASSYNIRISSSESLSSPIVDRTVGENYFRINALDNGLREGKYFWGVTQTDSEGNVSQVSEIRPFFVIKGNLEQHTIEPNNGFRISQALLPDTRFTWKKNLTEEFETEFQVSSDEGFNSILRTESTQNLNARISNLPVGTYYWRIKSFNANSGMEMVTAPKQFFIVPNLPKARLIAPVERAVARETVPYEFKWNPVEGADFYKLSIFSASDGQLIHEDNIYGNSCKIDMFNPAKFVDRNFYRYEIQAKSMAIPGIQTRLSGETSDNTFMLVKLRPVEIHAPARNAVITGLDAILNPIHAKWSSVDAVSRAQVVLYKVVPNREDEIVLKIPDDLEFARGNKVARNDVVLDTEEGLRAGDYKLVVYAQTYDGFDISNTDPKYQGRFTVLPVEPLDPVKNLVVTPEVFDASYLRNEKNPREIKVSWNKVPNATNYRVTIIRKSALDKKIMASLVNGTSYNIDISKMPDAEKRSFIKGKFEVIVEGVRRIDTDKDGKLDKVLQDGTPVKKTFETNVPMPKTSKSKGVDRPYGYTK